MQDRNSRKVVVAGTTIRLSLNASSPCPACSPLEATMKKTLLITGVLLALTATMASAGGINLAWNDCFGAGGGNNKPFACNADTGNNDLYISYDPPLNIPDLNGSNPLLDLQSASTPLPAWWQMKNIGTCRQNSISAISAITGTCPDSWAGVGVAGVAAYLTTGVLPSMPLNRARILGSVSVPGASAQPVDPGTEYFCLLIRVNNAKTAGAAGCAGCQDPVCIVLNEVLLTSNNSGDNRITDPLANNFAMWQGGAIGPPGCPAATPTSNRTWGQLKSIYR